MPKLQEIRQKRQEAADTITQMADTVARENRDFTADEKIRWDKANADYNRLEREERAERVREEQNRRVGDRDVGRDDYHGRGRDRDGNRRRDNVQHTEEQRSLAFRAWCKRQQGLSLRRQERDACKALRFNPSDGELRLGMWSDARLKDVQGRLGAVSDNRKAEVIARETRANMSTQIGTTGGYLIAPGTLVNALEITLLAFGGVRQVADIMTTTTGEPLFWPTVDDTSNVGALIAENTQAMSSGTNPTLAQKRYDAYKFTSTPVLIPTELLEDDQFDLAAMVGEMLGTRLGRGTAPYYATGTGASQPEGIVTGAATGITAASATAIAFDELIRLTHSIDPAYRTLPGVGWLMHDQIVSYIRRLKDGNGRPLWSAGEHYMSGVKEGVPDRLLGWNINVCQEMASSVATTAKTVLFGVLSKYKIRRVRDMRLYRLQERFRDLDQDGFIAFQREDGRLLKSTSDTTCPVKCLVQA